MRHWPLFGLRLRTACLELRLPADADLDDLAALAAAGIHDPAMMPFAVPWTDAPPGVLERSVLQYHWRIRGTLAPGDWNLSFGVWHEGRLVGTQSLFASAYPSRRVVETGSWLGRAHQRQGIGREMREAVLHLAFGGLGAEAALSAAFVDNAGSLRISEALGYALVATDTLAPRGTPQEHHRLRLERAVWLARAHPPVSIVGLEPCLPLLGAAAAG